MKYAKIIALLTIPAAFAGIMAAGLYHVSGSFTALFTADNCEAHTHAALIPIITVISIAAGFLPCLFYMATMLYPTGSNAEITLQETASEVHEQSIKVGQVISVASANCRVRIKAIKDNITPFPELNFSL